jgi:hypothetical protein
MPDVSRISVSTVREAWKKLSQGSPYYYYERGTAKDNVPGCALRVQRRSVQIGTRGDRGRSWIAVAEVPPDISAEDLDALRLAVRKKVRELEDEDKEPSFRQGRQMTMAELWAAYRDDYVRRRHAKRSPRTLEQRDDLWNCHLLPLFGELKLVEFAGLPPNQLARIPEDVAARVSQSRPWAEGRHTGNHCLHALRMTWDFARRRGWIVKDPLIEVDELDVSSAEIYLEDADFAAVGVALRALERQALTSSAKSRQGPSLGALLALRVAIYTGCRHVEELLKGKLPWLRRDFNVPRLEVPRAKGDRGDRHGRIIYLGPDALRCLLEIPRPDDCDDLVPGRLPGSQMARLTETWERVLIEARQSLEAQQADSRLPIVSAILRARLMGYSGETRTTVYPGEIRVPVKALRHSIKTLHPRAGIAPDHSRQLLGHEAASLGDRVYLHQHGPSLAAAAAQAEEYVRQLMGDLEKALLRFRRGV